MRSLLTVLLTATAAAPLDRPAAANLLGTDGGPSGEYGRRGPVIVLPAVLPADSGAASRFLTRFDPMGREANSIPAVF